ncbi:hypothetical protein CALCODRAFT_427209, partial [Calocera cornea HHB12733]
MLRARDTSVCPVLLGPTLPRRDSNKAEYDVWCRTMLILFCPWRRPCELKGLEETWTDAFERTEFDEDAMRIMDNICIQRECKDVRDEYSRFR